MSHAPTLSFVGCGKLGRSVGRLLHAQGSFRIGQILTTGVDSAREAAAFIGAGTPIDGFDALVPADIYALVTPDIKLGELAERLALRLRPGATVFHCSGALPSSLLEPCAERGAWVASVHPLLSFADPERAVRDFAGYHCAVEGDASAIAVLEPAFTALGAHVFRLATEHKLRYHAAAVLASNCLVTLTEQAYATLAAAGVSREDGAAMLLPLMRQTLDNLAALSPAAALTGPVARGDYELVRRQRADLVKVAPQIAEIYTVLANATAALAGREAPFP